MPTPTERLVESLESLEQLQSRGKIAIRTRDLSRTNRERLLKNGFLKEIMKGWYVPTRPDQPAGESTAWYASYWDFCSDYLRDRFGDDWCLSPEHSLALHVGTRTVPRQLIVRSPKGRNNVTPLPENTSILDVNMQLPPKADRETLADINTYCLPAALVAASSSLFRQSPTDVRAALSAIGSASDLLSRLLEGGHTIIAGRLAGAFQNIGRARVADEIVSTMRAAGFDCREEDPFESPTPILLTKRERSPYVSRVRLMWQSMRGPIIKTFPTAPGLPKNKITYMDRVQENYVTDAYHSLSIEGYKVTRDLINQVRKGNWNPDADDHDRQQRDALAARGYWQAYLAVRKSLKRVLSGENAGEVADDDHGAWYRELFAPSVAAGFLKPGDLAGYRNDQVFIRHSKHVPPGKEAVRELMPALFDLLHEEPDAGVRVVLGHFLFVYIHPYMDGNGRIGRFLMNVMLASGGYPWTVVPVSRRADYFKALEEASVNQNIEPFAKLIGKLVKETIAGKPEAS
ncbi:MAG: Fic family protein [Candidatus Obscuribacterales bacterium]|nr:Fic family protein [Candidatus Obscuribacterales bacterium]